MSLRDVTFWWPHIAKILESHGLYDDERESVAGVGGSYPTFVYGDIVVKLFGYVPSWRKSFESERGAQVLLATDPEIAVPKLIVEGLLYEEVDAGWPYLITTRMSGVSWSDAELTTEQRLAVAADLGMQLRRVHALPPSGVATDADWPNLNVAAAAERSSLPPHLIAQIDDYLLRLGPFDRVFVHGDLFSRHAFVENGRLTGIIDWGDAMVTDRHYEIAKLHLDTFCCDKALLRVFLEACNWPVSNDFPKRALGQALLRQAVGLAQHFTNDVFYLVADLFPLKDIGTLDELASELFAI